jgi:hypothetical protein
MLLDHQESPRATRNGIPVRIKAAPTAETLDQVETSKSVLSQSRARRMRQVISPIRYQFLARPTGPRARVLKRQRAALFRGNARHRAARRFLCLEVLVAPRYAPAPPSLGPSLGTPALGPCPWLPRHAVGILARAPDISPLCPTYDAPARKIANESQALFVPGSDESVPDARRRRGDRTPGPGFRGGDCR